MRYDRKACPFWFVSIFFFPFLIKLNQVDSLSLSIFFLLLFSFFAVKFDDTESKTDPIEWDTVIIQDR